MSEVQCQCLYITSALLRFYIIYLLYVYAASFTWVFCVFTIVYVLSYIYFGPLMSVLVAIAVHSGVVIGLTKH